jgi:hypothetical protein
MPVDVAVDRIWSVFRALAVGVKRFLAARRAQEDRAVVHGSEQLDAHVHFRRVAQTTRPELKVAEALAVGAQRHVVVDAAFHVGPVAGEDFPVRGFFEVEHTERFSGFGDYIRCGRRRLGERAALDEGCHSTERGDVRARGEKAKEVAPRLIHPWLRDPDLPGRLRVLFEERLLVLEILFSRLHAAHPIGDPRHERVLARRRAGPRVGEELPAVLLLR